MQTCKTWNPFICHYREKTELGWFSSDSIFTNCSRSLVTIPILLPSLASPRGKADSESPVHFVYIRKSKIFAPSGNVLSFTFWFLYNNQQRFRESLQHISGCNFSVFSRSPPAWSCDVRGGAVSRFLRNWGRKWIRKRSTTFLIADIPSAKRPRALFFARHVFKEGGCGKGCNDPLDWRKG